MAHTKAGGSTQLGRDSQSKRLGVKKYGGEYVKPGMIIIRQRGTKVHAGVGVKQGKDDTLYAGTEGKVAFSTRKLLKYHGKRVATKIVNVIPIQ
ncbi:MAG: 50S ribosomal protein L27 [Candidatus Jacksonbacteria bacterium RIFCSPLOWO2_02_FULL_43_9]|nr:MAG: 50S ribosomal protein L27 [Parcubacteria group bacterium GW2011_GWA2_43_13]OGY69728.1 MAG: 50S ribosomal protein L27 [Candidatus Jacksonbacteria bacterium RIFCSPHIGHO2_02_FULL_43_10]OGY71459.1 MAG: 50S ribosomal protein L27 [Candidatus Jacksonbacteria bacterium RIFCSPLOWO2_01_FULL_44_13]OGY72120.1 MAG: 50S ribosomal protein L27 [Candidatus Jacksonbacteria bacterium RIFCSPLOWO2_02_FULL_43_9]HAZ16653.1 50S ribosomal protein L27 [Candidatus Jacksonbacteria bacterium]